MNTNDSSDQLETPTASSSTDLLACPHCGETNVKVEWEPCMPLGEDDTNRNWFVECQKCGAQGPCSNREDRARQYWNQRHANTELSDGGTKEHEQH